MTHRRRRFSVDETLSNLHILRKRRGSVDSLGSISNLSLRLTQWKKRTSLPLDKSEIHYRKHGALHDLKLRISDRKTPQFVYVMVELPDGKKKLLSGEDGGGIKETLAEAAMDHRISSYRLIMASTRAILNSTSTESTGSAFIDQALEDVFEESDIPEGICVPTDDSRFETVLEILKTEREFYNLLQMVLDVYAESFRKFSSLSKEHHKTLFFGVEPILSISAMLNTKLEDALNSWDTTCTQIGNLFSNKFWNHLDEYCKNYSKTRRLLEEKFSSDSSFVEFCNLRKGKSEHSIDSLLYLPVQRIPEYDKYLNDLLDETDSSHPDYDDLTRAATRVRNMVREHEDELGTSENQVKMERIQKRFPNDDLQLGETNPTQTLRSLSHRRKSAPGAVLFKTLGNKSKSTGNLLSGANMGKKELDNFRPNKNIHHSVDRHYVMEGAVEFAVGMQTQDRYLFLFNDLLLIAKQKSSTTFKLKHRVRVCEIWLATCIYDVSEITRPAEKSFVIGWPTTNVVATFKTVELKEEWLNKLNEQIEEEKAKEIPETLKIKIKSRDLDKTCTVEVDNRVESEEVLKRCMNQLNLQSSDVKDYQIWVRSGKEESPYPLIGHELPYSIHQSHIRDIYAKTNEPMIPENFDRVLSEAPPEMKVELIIKHSKKSPKKPNYDENSSKNKKNKRSPLITFFRRHKDDKNNNNAPPGKLFGHSLSDVVEGGLPHSVMELLRILFREGPYTKGILRKSPNAKMCKELRQRLDDGEDCISEDCPPLVIGALLKDYLRSLPQCLLIEDLYDQWLNLTEEDESPEKLQKVKQLLMKLPVYHFDMLRHLMCVLYYIDKKNEINMMTSYNLAVCIAPSILWSKIHGDPIKALATTNSPQAIVQYLIDNCGEVFGEESLYLFGAPVEQKMRQDSSTDSDSMHSVLSMPDSGSGSALRRDDSSIDSLEREFYPGDMDSSPNLAKSHLSPSNLSRDSGLTLSDTQLYEDDGSSVEMLNDRGKNYGRSVSHFYDRDSEKVRYDNIVSRSYDTGYSSYDVSNPKPPPRKNRRKGSEQSDSQSPDMEQFRHQTRYSSNNRSAMSQSMSTEAFSRLSKTTSSESLKGLEERENESSNLHDWKKSGIDYGTLVKSASGAHLFFDEESTSHVVTEIDISGAPQRSNQKLVRQASVTSTPPMSPESKYSQSSSFDSFLTDSSASYLSRQLSKETTRSNENRSSWYLQEDQTLQDSLKQKSQNDSSNRDNRNLSVQQNFHNIQYYSSPTSSQSYSHQNLAVTRSFPLDYNVSPKGSGSSTAKEAEDIMDPAKVSNYDSSSRQRSNSPRYSNSPSDNVSVSSNMPLKQITKYTTGLGTSPPPKVLLHHMQQKSTPRRENTPLRASHDSAIISQVRRSSFDCVEGDLWRRNSTEHQRSEYHLGKLQYHPPSPTLSRSESDPDLNRTCSNSPDGKNRPDKPPSYDEALQRNFMIRHGIPLEISEQDSEKQKEVSAKARQLYEQSLRQYMQEHLNSPSPTKTDTLKRIPQKKDVIVEREEEEESSEGEEIIISSKDPRKIYEESLKRYNESGEKISSASRKSSNVQIKFTQNQSPIKRDTNHLSVPVCNLQRSFSDSADHADKLERWRRRSPREHSPLAQDHTRQREGFVEKNSRLSTDCLRESSPSSRRENSPNRSSLSHSSSSVSNSSSDTVIENPHNPPYRRERTDSSPTIDRHYFRTADSYLKQYNYKKSVLQTGSDKHQDSSTLKSRDSSVDSNYSSYKERDSSNSRSSEHSSYNRTNSSRKEEFRDNSDSVSRTENRNLTSDNTVRNEPSYRRQLLNSSENVVQRNATEKQDTSRSKSTPGTSNSKDLPWSVKQLRNKFQGNSEHSSKPESASPVSRPPPPPYQPPPPFRRTADSTRTSTSSNSSLSSTSTDRSSKHYSAHKYGGPQARDSFSSSDDSDVSSRCSGHHRLDTSNSSDDLSKWRFTDVSYV